jgi:uncharacterized protein YecE (DUF72 family)
VDFKSVADSKLYCGTSGFAYESWRPEFYPPKLPASQYLQYYATRLNAVEINYTYRRIAAASTFEKWIQSTQEGFVFLPKAHMKITHSLKLVNADEFTRVFLDSLQPLQSAGKLGPILFQLPPSLKVDPPRLSEFLGGLPRGVRVAFEFRNSSWFSDKVYEALQTANAALCFAENENLETPFVITGDFVYLRLRKPDYSESELEAIDWRIRQYRSNGYPVFAIFKHEESAAGALHAEALLHKSDVPEEPGLVSGLIRE